MEIERFRPGMPRGTEVATLLAESIGNATEEKLQELIQSCASDEFPSIWIARYNDEIVGVLRLDSRDIGCTITHIATHPGFRRRGIGRKLVEFIREKLKFGHTVAETDDDGVSFYKACGFDIESQGKNEFGVQRYKCVRRF